MTIRSAIASYEQLEAAVETSISPEAVASGDAEDFVRRLIYYSLLTQPEYFQLVAERLRRIGAHVLGMRLLATGIARFPNHHEIALSAFYLIQNLYLLRRSPGDRFEYSDATAKEHAEVFGEAFVSSGNRMAQICSAYLFAMCDVAKSIEILGAYSTALADQWRTSYRQLGSPDQLPRHSQLCVLAGPGKTGTTSLERIFGEGIPAVLFPGKEINYFEVYRDLPKEWYFAHFDYFRGDDKAPIRWVDASPAYFGNAAAIELLSRLSVDVKVIVTLRDPLERTLSHYRHNVSVGILDGDPEVAMKSIQCDIDELKSGRFSGANPIANSRYEKYISHWERAFERDSLLILRTDKEASENLAAVVGRFVGCARPNIQVLPRLNLARSSLSLPQAMTEEIRALLDETYQYLNNL